MKKIATILLTLFMFGVSAQNSILDKLKTDTLVKSVQDVGKGITETVKGTIGDVKGTLKGTDSTIMENVKQLMPDSNSMSFKLVYDDIKMALHSLADGLKVGTEAVFKILVLQQIVKSIVWTLMFVFAICIIFWMKGVYKKAEFGQDKGNFFNFLFVIQFIATFVFFMYFFCNIFEVVTGFVNPAYGAIRDIFEFIKDKNIK